MKSTLIFAAVASAAVIKRQAASDCCFGINISGAQAGFTGSSGSLGELYDGQIRVGPGYSNTTFCYNEAAGTIVDQAGRGCVEIGAPQQYQCDESKVPSSGITIDSAGVISHNGSSIWYECLVNDQGVYNIYTADTGYATQCQQIKLTTTNGNCASKVSTVVQATTVAGPTVTVSAQASTVTASAQASTVTESAQVSTVTAPAAAAQVSTVTVSGAGSAATVTAQATCPAAKTITVTESAASAAATVTVQSSCPAAGAAQTVTVTVTAAAASAQTVTVTAAAASAQTVTVTAAAASAQTATVTAAAASAKTVTVTAPASAAQTVTVTSVQSCATQTQVEATTVVSVSKAVSTEVVPTTVVSVSNAVSTEAVPTTVVSVSNAVSTKVVPTTVVSVSNAVSTEVVPTTVVSEQTTAKSTTAVVTSVASVTSSSSAVSTSSSAVPTTSSAISTTSSVVSTTSSSAASTSTAAVCPENLSGLYTYPHLIVPVSSAHPDTAYGTQYFAYINSVNSTIFNIDVESSWAGKTCELIFTIPDKSLLETTDYTYSSQGSFAVSQLDTVATQATDYSNMGASTSVGTFPITVGTKTVITSGSCAAGTTQSFEFSSASGLALTWFNDWNPCPLGVFMVAY